MCVETCEETKRLCISCCSGTGGDDEIVGRVSAAAASLNDIRRMGMDLATGFSSLVVALTVVGGIMVVVVVVMGLTTILMGSFRYVSGESMRLRPTGCVFGGGATEEGEDSL